MEQIDLSSWAEFKSVCVGAPKYLPCQFRDNGNSYDLFGPDNDAFMWTYNITKDGGADVTDFETNYKSKFNGSIVQYDTDGAQLSRVKVAPTGWNFNYRMIELETASVGGISNLDPTGADVGDALIKCYDVSGTLVTDPALNSTVVKTVVEIEPPYNICVAGGALRMSVKPTQDVILNVTAVPDIPAISGGSKLFVQNVNLSYIDGAIGLDADGRAAKQLNYSATLHTNKFRFQFTHPAGYQFWCAILMEIYKQ